MSKRCTKCGQFMMDDEKFCPKCGENAGTVPTQAEQATQYAQPVSTNQPVNQSYVPQYNPEPEKEMTVKSWVGTIIVTTWFGPISLIMLFVWGFGSGPKARQNYCKAALIIYLIGVIASILFSIIFVVLIATAGDAFLNSLNDYMEEIEKAAKAIASCVI